MFKLFLTSYWACLTSLKSNIGKGESHSKATKVRVFS